MAQQPNTPAGPGCGVGAVLEHPLPAGEDCFPLGMFSCLINVELKNHQCLVQPSPFYQVLIKKQKSLYPLVI
jgi:hypothetical protein